MSFPIKDYSGSCYWSVSDSITISIKRILHVFFTIFPVSYMCVLFSMVFFTHCAMIKSNQALKCVMHESLLSSVCMYGFCPSVRFEE